jgi:methyl-accepting chemotaxis protein
MVLILTPTVHSLKPSGEKKKPFRARLLAFSATGIVLLSILGGGILYLMSSISNTLMVGLDNADHQENNILAVEQAHIHFKTQVQEWKDILLRGNDPANFAKYSKQFADHEKSTQEKLGEALKLQRGDSPLASDIRALMAAHKELGNKYRDALKRFDSSDAQAGHTVDKLVKGMDRATGEGLTKLVAKIEADTTSSMATMRMNATRDYSRAKLFGIVTILASMLILGLYAWRTTRTLLSQLGGEPAEAAKIARLIAGGDLAVTIDTRATEDSVLGAIARMQAELRGMLAEIHESSRQLIGSVHAVSAVSHTLVSGAAQQHDASSSIAAAVEEQSTSIASVSDNAKRTHEISIEVGKASVHGEEVARRVSGEMRKVAEVVQRSSGQIIHLGEQSQQINSIVNVIKDIADQTNLLALNAAIEAARAGEQGRGFAVVADEVRKLAERTAKSTQDIAAMIEGIRGGIAEAVENMGAGDESMKEGVRMAQEAGEAMISIRRRVEELVHAAADISTALAEQNAAGEQIAVNVETVARMAEEANAEANKASATASDMETLARNLEDMVKRFKL